MTGTQPLFCVIKVKVMEVVDSRVAEAIKHIIIIIIGDLIFLFTFLNNEGFVYNGLLLLKIEHSDYYLCVGKM